MGHAITLNETLPQVSCYNKIHNSLSTRTNKIAKDSTGKYSIYFVTEFVWKAALSGYKYVFKMIKLYKHKRMATKLKEEEHVKRAEFIALVLERLPFLYTYSKEIENAQWVKIAYDLNLKGKLLPSIVRYQTGPYYFISFGSISTQIKRHFFTLFLSNDKTGNSKMIYPSKRAKTKFTSNESSDSYCNIPIKMRKHAVNEFFEYMTSEEIKSIIMNGDRTSVDFHKDFVVQDDSQTDWFHKWGYVYETEMECYRALEAELKNYSLELSVLDNFLELGVSFAELPATPTGTGTLKDLIEEKRRLIREKYIPTVLNKKAIRSLQLSKCKPNTTKYNELMSY